MHVSAIIVGEPALCTSSWKPPWPLLLEDEAGTMPLTVGARVCVGSGVGAGAGNGVGRKEGAGEGCGVGIGVARTSTHVCVGHSASDSASWNSSKHSTAA
jgi:hypothetical protein